jgi:hypothetical protein
MSSDKHDLLAHNDGLDHVYRRIPHIQNRPNESIF